MATPLQLPQYNMADRVAWAENGVEYKGRYIGADPVHPEFARIQPDDERLLTNGENSILLHPSQLRLVTTLPQILPSLVVVKKPEADKGECPPEPEQDKPELGDSRWHRGQEVLIIGIEAEADEYQVRPAGAGLVKPPFMVSGTELSREGEPTKLPEQSTAGAPQKSENELVPDFATIARAAVGRGEPHVVPIVVGGKNPAVKWKNDPDYNIDMYSTPEMNQISDKWIQALINRGFKNHNAAVIARPDNVLFIDDDRHAEFVVAYEAWSGEKYPHTYATSARENRWQLHFYQTDKTRGLGNIIQTQVNGLDFSVRQSNEYVVAEGSIYKDGVNVYRCVDPAAIVPMPDKLVEFITKKVAESGRTKSSPTKATINEDGTRKLIPQGFIHDALFAQAKLLRDVGLSPSGIESALLGWYHENCEPPAAGREAAASEKVKQVAASVGSAGQLTIGGLPVGAGSVPPEPTPEEKAAQALGITVEEVNRARDESTGETKQQGVDDEPEESFDDDTGMAFPTWPIFTGPLTDLAKALFPSVSLEFKQIGLIARWGLMRSGLDTLRFEPHLQPRFDIIMVSPPNRGKTAANNETRIATEKIVSMAKELLPAGQPCVFGDVVNVASADSGPWLVEKLYDLSREAKEKVSGGLTTDGTAKLMLDPDEMSDVFEKARSSNQKTSTLFTEIMKLSTGNRTGNGTRRTGYKPVDNAHFAMLGGTTVKKYETLWVGTGGGGDGLMSRVIPVTTNASQVPPVPLPTDSHAAYKAYERLAKLALMPGQEISFNPEAVRMLNDWWATVDGNKASATRVLEMVKELLLVLAPTNVPEGYTGTELTVGPELMAQAIDFGKSIIATRELLNPADSWSNVQLMENAVIDWMRKNASRKNPKTRNECRRGVTPHKKPGGLGAFKLGWDNCVGVGVLKVRAKTQRATQYSL